MKLPYHVHGALLAIALATAGCESNGTDAVYLRVYNNSDYDFDSVNANGHYFGHVPSASYSAYAAMGETYRYAGATAKLGDKWVRYDIIDYVGETPLEPGRYTYLLSADPEGDYLDLAFFEGDNLPHGPQPADTSRRSGKALLYVTPASSLDPTSDIIVSGSRMTNATLNPTISKRPGSRVIYLPDARTGRFTTAAYIARLNGSSGDVVWQRPVGPDDVGSRTFVATTAAGNHVLGAETREVYDVVVSGYPQGWRTENLLFRIDAAGNEIWSRVHAHTVREMIPLSDGGFALSGLRGYKTPAFTLIDADGTERWSRSYPDLPAAESIVQLPHGGFIVAGDPLGTIYSGDAGWAMRTDASGNPVWSVRFSGSVFSIAPTPDGGVVIAGKTTGVNSQPRLLRLGADGTIVWTRTFGGGTLGVIKALADGFVAAGGLNGFRMIKIDFDGNLVWDRRYQDIAGEANDLHQLPDGDFVLSGNGMFQMRVLRVSPTGEVRWHRDIGHGYSFSRN
jgi:hypothetical protein